jgi:hypothetical protein
VEKERTVKITIGHREDNIDVKASIWIGTSE